MFGWLKPKKNYVVESIEQMIKANHWNKDFLEGYITACYTLSSIKEETFNDLLKNIGVK